MLIFKKFQVDRSRENGIGYSRDEASGLAFNTMNWLRVIQKLICLRFQKDSEIDPEDDYEKILRF